MFQLVSPRRSFDERLLCQHLYVLTGVYLHFSDHDFFDDQPTFVGSLLSFSNLCINVVCTMLSGLEVPGLSDRFA